MSYARAMSPVERVWAVASRMAPPFTNQLVMEGTGTPSLAAWTEAVSRASEVNPGCRLGLSGMLTGCTWTPSDTAPEVIEVDGTHWDARSGDGAPFLLRPLPYTGPSTEVLLVRGDTPRVIVRTQHAVMDGRGHLHFTAEVFRALRGEPLVGSSATLTDHEIATALKPQPAPRRDATVLSPLGDSELGLPKSLEWRRRTVDVKPNRLLARILHGLATQARSSPGRVRIDVPVDMRRHLHELGMDASPSTANLTGLLHIEIPEDATLDSLTDTVREQLDQAREAEFVAAMNPLRFLPLWFMGNIGQWTAERQHRANRWLGTAVVSNLGRLPLDGLRGPSFTTRTAFFIPPGTQSTPLFMALCGTPAGVEICATAPSRLASGGRLDACLDQLVLA